MSFTRAGYFFFFLSALTLVSACGARTGLPVPESERDAGIDAPEDAAIDVPEDRPDADLCIELPPEEPPEFVDVAFEARISTADVLFLIDTTGSMGDEIRVIQERIRDVIAPALQESIRDVQLSVAEFADFPVSPYGEGLDIAYVQSQRSTNDLEAVQRAMDRVELRSGGDFSESQTEALFQAAAGVGRGRFVPPRVCPSGTVGYPCFRANGSRIILLFTDASFHNGPGGSEPYDRSVTPTPATFDEAVDELNAIGAKVLGLFSGGDFGGDDPAISDLRAVARATGAVTPDGEPLLVDIGGRGERLDEGVIDVVQRLVEEVPIDIDAFVEDGPGDDFDARMFVTGIETLSASPPSGAIDLGDRFERVLPGTRVQFRILLQNETFPRTEEPQSYFLTIVLRGDGATRLTETTVEVVIPSITGEGCEEAL